MNDLAIEQFIAILKNNEDRLKAVEDAVYGNMDKTTPENPEPRTLVKDLESIINYHEIDLTCNMPDWLIADYLYHILLNLKYIIDINNTIIPNSNRTTK